MWDALIKQRVEQFFRKFFFLKVIDEKLKNLNQREKRQEGKNAGGNMPIKNYRIFPRSKIREKSQETGTINRIFFNFFILPTSNLWKKRLNRLISHTNSSIPRECIYTLVHDSVCAEWAYQAAFSFVCLKKSFFLSSHHQ